jgi:transmembrane sensor
MTHAAEIEERAATWLARRDAGLKGGEEAEFAAWLASDARHRAAYLRLSLAWQRSARLSRLRPEGEPIDADLLAPPRAPSLWKSWRRPWRPLSLGASLAAVMALMAWWVVGPGATRTYRTEIGELSRVVLKDGSAVTLNTDSELRVHFTNERRQVDLVRGEAQFQVAHDTQLPFEVAAAGRIVRAVGTAFDVRLGEGQSVEVMVTEGRVSLVGASDQGPSGAGAPALTTLAAGESAVANGDQVSVRRIAATEVSRRLAWESGELSFQGETLSQAVAEFNRYNRRKLKVEDPSIEGLAIGGNFQALDVESFVAALDRSFGIHSRTTSDRTVILERATSPSSTAPLSSEQASSQPSIPE